jgi:hypothetical protein
MAIQIVHHTKANEPDAITSYIHCQRCVAEVPAGESPKSYARLSVGLTKDGIQVYCARHEINVTRMAIQEKKP